MKGKIKDLYKNRMLKIPCTVKFHSTGDLEEIIHFEPINQTFTIFYSYSISKHRKSTIRYDMDGQDLVEILPGEE